MFDKEVRAFKEKSEKEANVEAPSFNDNTKAKVKKYIKSYLVRGKIIAEQSQ